MVTNPKYVVEIRCGFDGGSETYEYMSYVQKAFHRKAKQVFSRGANPQEDAPDYIYYELNTIPEIKTCVAAIIKAGKDFWCEEHSDKHNNVNLYIDDDAHVLYKSGKHEITADPKNDDFAYITIKQFGKKTVEKDRSTGLPASFQIPMTRMKPTSGMFKSQTGGNIYSALSSGMLKRRK